MCADDSTPATENASMMSLGGARSDGLVLARQPVGVDGLTLIG
jgi:hypothetical protein